MAEENLNQGQQANAEASVENVSAQAEKILDTAVAEAKGNGLSDSQNGEGQPVLKDDSGSSSSIGDKFKGLPMRELIAAPLIAAAEAQQELASTAWDYFNKIAFYGKDEKSDAQEGDTRILKFNVNRPVVQNGQMKFMKQEVQAPFIGLVPVPSLLIDRVDVDFQMEVTDTTTNKNNFSSEASTKLSGNWFVKAEVSGKISTSRENTRTTNQTGKYQVHVTASQQHQTEGLSKLMDIMASCIEPVSTDTSEK